MIAARREIQLSHEGEFAEGLASWIRGDDCEDAEAAAGIFAETVLLHRAWLRAHIKDT